MKILSAAELFIKQAYRNPLWYLATVVFLALAGFIYSHQSSSPGEQARLEATINEREEWIEDGRRVCDMHRETVSMLEAIGRPLDQIQSIHKAMLESGKPPDRKQLEENYDSAVKAKKRLELLIARFKGIHFRLPILEEEARRYEALLVSHLRILKTIEDFCAVYLAGDTANFTQQIDETASQFSTMLKELETDEARQESIKFQLDREVRLNLTETKKAIAQATILSLKGYAQIPAAILCIVYLVAIGRGVAKVSKTSNRMSLPRKQGMRRHGKRKRGR